MLDVLLITGISDHEGTIHMLCFHTVYVEKGIQHFEM